MNFYGRYKTSDGRLLYGCIDGYGNFVVCLGNIGVFKFQDEEKAERKINFFIKELNAIEL